MPEEPFFNRKGAKSAKKDMQMGHSLGLGGSTTFLITAHSFIILESRLRKGNFYFGQE
jgi:hypothetical protein